ncbi:MAG TPA: YbaK/EbsC family protein [Terriglobia bacterium]|nr:YbaK/EbsC family protein [Terriglobia bacterium]
MISMKLMEHLDQAGVPYTHHTHPTAYTAQEVAAVAHIPGREMVKTVLLNADDNALVMAVLSSNDTVDLDVLWEELGCQTLRLATESEFRDAFPTCKTGAMPPFGSLFNLSTYCEATLARNREIEFNAGTHEETIRMAFDDFEQLENPKVVHFARPYQEHPQRLAA